MSYLDCYDDQRFEGIDVRRTSAYRTAVWCQRLSYVCVVIWTFIGVPPPIQLRQILAMAGRRAGVRRLNRVLRLAGIRFAPWFKRHLIADEEIRRQFYRDLIWLPPR